MGNFKQHSAAGSTVAVLCGLSVYFTGLADVYTALLGSIFCYLGSILPDLDSESGRPIKEISAMIASVAGVGAVIYMIDITTDPVKITLGFFIGFLVTRFGVVHVVSKISKHRGMFHSIPAAIIYGLIMVVAYYNTKYVMILAGVASIGYFTHLIVDEYYGRGLKSAGTAMKLKAKSSSSTLMTWSVLIGLVLYLFTNSISL